MLIKFAARSAFAATLLGLALTATTPAHAYVEAGMLSCRSPGTAGYIVFRRAHSIASSTLLLALRRNIIRRQFSALEPKSASPMM